MYRAPIIYVVFLWRMGKALPPYFADSEPDLRAIGQEPRITAYVVRKTSLVYEQVS